MYAAANATPQPLFSVRVKSGCNDNRVGFPTNAENEVSFQMLFTLEDRAEKRIFVDVDENANAHRVRGCLPRAVGLAG